MASEIQPLHQKSYDTSANVLLKKKLLEKPGKSNGIFASPTDKILSPCTKKINDHKSRFLNKAPASKLNLNESSIGKDIEDILNHQAKKQEEPEIDDEEIMKDVDLDDI